MKNNFLRVVERRKLSKFFKGGGERRRQNIFKGGGMKKNNIWGWGRGEKKKNIFVLKDRYLEDGSASQYQASRMRRFDFYKKIILLTDVRAKIFNTLLYQFVNTDCYCDPTLKRQRWVRSIFYFVPSSFIFSFVKNRYIFLYISLNNPSRSSIVRFFYFDEKFRSFSNISFVHINDAHLQLGPAYNVFSKTGEQTL